MKNNLPLVFEVSWEVCNKVGGIYTVVSSKAATMVNHYGDNYFLVGPFFPKKVHGIFEDGVPPAFLNVVFEELKKEGINCVFGHWLVKGSPPVILIDFSKYAQNKNSIKNELWNKFKIDSLNTSYFDFDESVIWAWCAGRLIHLCSKNNVKVVAHAHEWLSASSILYLRLRCKDVACVFTTHATTIGRTIANNGRDLYAELKTIDADKFAKESGADTFAKHTLEKVCAKNAHVFTTVSEITSIEAEYLLGQKPEILVFNGLDIDKFPTFEETTIKHKLYKQKYYDFLQFYFFPYYSFNLNHTRIFFICGRNEFRDKGIDLAIEALGRLNRRLKKEETKKTIVTFIFVPGPAREMYSELVESKTEYTDIKETINDNIVEINNKLLNSIITNTEIKDSVLFDDDLHVELKRKQLKFLRNGCCPPVITHHLTDESNNLILKSINNAGLTNKKEDRVKIVYYPIYLSGADGLLDTSYYESMMGGHLGLFPSYYEPWGYTPHECAALGVPAITTDLAGFGRYLQKVKMNSKNPGVWIIKRFEKTYEESVEELTCKMHEFLEFSQRERVANKISAKSLVQNASWSRFGKYYFDAHNLALDRI